MITPALRLITPLVLVFALAFTPAVMATEAPADGADRININTADARTLAEGLSGIGEARAAAIVEFRETEGDFVTLEHLEEVPGIGMNTVENNRGRMTVD